MSEFPELRAALLAAAHDQVTATAAGAPSRSERHRRGRGWSRVPRLRGVALALLALLPVTAVSLAATGVIPLGGTATRPALPTLPRRGDGAVMSGSARLVVRGVPDPAGGSPWGLRVTRTTRGEVCLLPGRLSGDELGVLGDDGAFGDDGRLHPFADDFLEPDACGTPDAAGHAFLSVAWYGYPASAADIDRTANAGGCRIGHRWPGQERRACPRSSLRDVYEGLLGPDAVSLTYRTASGATRTVATSGADGAYLVVLPYSGHRPAGLMTAGRTLGTPFAAIHYRGGRTCHVSRMGSCRLVGLRVSRAPRVTEAEVRSPLRVRVFRARAFCTKHGGARIVACDGRLRPGMTRLHVKRPGAMLIEVSFVARRAVTSSAADYELDDVYSHAPGCYSDGGGLPYGADVRAGERLRMQDLVPRDCVGRVQGRVLYWPAGANYDPGPPTPDTAHPLVVGRFIVNPARARR